MTPSSNKIEGLGKHTVPAYKGTAVQALRIALSMKPHKSTNNQLCKIRENMCIV